ncbi:hypothetical protein HanHA300_Chr03g0081841 [Helianthus annuus]|nr:hypothetical protein HanHA300_Chr03g0081841 [Helianthus annuus]KAJ0607162.1 hypothetical protein HanHA89_Chr03g0093291 [Helianthus annuus]KAJ0767216.1 hypothetical protein HanLR1_Chr03g0086521 [Helianthus annuus]KAJ0773069.1 hypothetical protein HanOQP8_Chr03g0094631 [Helianthus annuus]
MLESGYKTLWWLQTYLDKYDETSIGYHVNPLLLVLVQVVALKNPIQNRIYLKHKFQELTRGSNFDPFTHVHHYAKKRKRPNRWCSIIVYNILNSFIQQKRSSFDTMKDA